MIDRSWKLLERQPADHFQRLETLESKHYQTISTHHLDCPKAWYMQVNEQLHSLEKSTGSSILGKYAAGVTQRG